MGDFNINLLNFESHSPTEEFFNTMTSYFFQPHIIQPTRITDHSATLIDNIYLNTIEYKTNQIKSNNLFHTFFYKKEDRLTIRKYKYYYNGAGKLE